MPALFHSPQFWILATVICAIIGYDIWVIAKCRARFFGIVALCAAFIPLPFGIFMGVLVASPVLGSSMPPAEFVPFAELAHRLMKFGGFGTVAALILAIIGTVEIRKRRLVASQH